MAQRVAIVTGGIGGLGTEICRHLAQAGRKVIAADLGNRQERLAAFREEVKEFGDRIVFAPADISRFEDCEALVKHVGETYGEPEILVNAAGITRDVSLRKMTQEQWHDLMRVNLDGVFNMCRHASFFAIVPDRPSSKRPSVAALSTHEECSWHNA